MKTICPVCKQDVQVEIWGEVEVVGAHLNGAVRCAGSAN